MPLTSNENIFRALFEHSSVGIIITKANGNMEMVNPFAAKLFGYNTGELVGNKVEVLLPEKFRAEHVKLRKRYCQNPQPRAMGAGIDLLATKKDGTTFYAEVSLSFYYFQEELHIVSFVNDVSENKRIKMEMEKQAEELDRNVKKRTMELSHALVELNHINEDLEKEVEKRKKTEEQVRQALEKEKELSELKSRFVSMASHEFRTPLGGILSSSTLIAKYPSTEQQDKRLKHIHKIKRSVKNLTSILNDFLSSDKLDEGRITANPSEFEVLNFFEEFIEDFQEVTEREGQNKIIYNHIGSDGCMLQDREMLRNVLSNLVSNAIKYSPDNTTVNITSKLEQRQLKISVVDRGMGIPEVEQKHLFKRFFRAKNASTIQGTGLGLNIVKRYLDYMGGKIDFESKENLGTTFKVEIPQEIKA